MENKANAQGIFTNKIEEIACPYCDAELDVSEFEPFETLLCPKCDGQVEVPVRLGNFILFRELGGGSMGTVYLAQDESLGRLVALKVMRREYGEDEAVLANLQTEAQAMAALNHRNVIQVYSYGEVSGQPFIVMEFLEGEKLDELVGNRTELTELRLLQIAEDVIKGLQAADAADLNHGDVKPGNILLNDRGVAKVVDFGMARFEEPGHDVEALGTPYYIAPEKAKEESVDARSDQYSLGATLFHVLAGEPPFVGDDPTATVIAAIKEPTPELKKKRDDISADTNRIVRKMMDKDPDKRYQTYAALLADLAEAMENVERRDQAAAEQERLALEQARKPKGRLIVPIIAAAAIIAISIAAAILVPKLLSGGPSVSYEGRSLSEPFKRAEIRVLGKAVDAARSGDKQSFAAQANKLVRNMPDDVEYHGERWGHFLVGVMYVVLKDKESALTSLELAAADGDVLYEVGRAPVEDPRVVAKLALGKTSEDEWDAHSKRGKVWYQDMGALALAIHKVLNEGGKGAKEALRPFSSRREATVTWPYRLQPLCTIIPDVRL